MAIRNSPLITQYLSVKQRVPDAILFFRLGDFYEMFFEDAETGSRLLDIQLTSRSKDGVPLCGVPYHSAEPYIAKLLKAGMKVAICEQTAPETTPSAASAKGGAFQLSAPGARGNGRGLMPRQIVRVITPGTVGEETVLTADEKNFLLALSAGASGFAVAAIDVSTGEFIVAPIHSLTALREEIARIAPREVVFGAGRDRAAASDARRPPAVPTSAIEATPSTAPRCRGKCCGGVSARAARRSPPTAAIAMAAAAGAALAYIEENFGRRTGRICALALNTARPIHAGRRDHARHLELTESSDGTRIGSLLSILDRDADTDRGAPLSNWIVYPLMDLGAIRARHDAVDELFELDLGGEVADSLRRMGDLERLAGRLGSRARVAPRRAELGQALGRGGDAQALTLRASGAARCCGG